MRPPIFFLGILSIAISSFSQGIIDGILTINLAQNQGKIIRLTKSPFTLKAIVLENRLIGKGINYEWSAEDRIQPIPPLEFNYETQIGVASSSECTKLDKLLKSLSISTDESNLPLLIDSIQDIQEIIKVRKLACQSLIDSAKKAIAGTLDTLKMENLSISLNKDRELQITIKRDTKIWSIIYSTEKTSHWSVLYGFTYISNYISPMKTYYAKQDTGNSFIITPSDTSNLKKIFQNITPTLMFTWHTTFKDSWLQFGGVGGISLNLLNPTAMVGPAIIIGENLSLNSGIVFTQKNALVGKYISGQRITDNLDFDQLHEKVCVAELFFSIGFRFATNPFGTKEKSDSK